MPRLHIKNVMIPSDPHCDPHCDCNGRCLVLNDHSIRQKLDRIGGFERHPHIAVGVSGGGDSTTMAWILSRWLKKKGGILSGLIVDHRARKESADEAKHGQARLARLNIPCHILPIQKKEDGDCTDIHQDDFPRNLQAMWRQQRMDRLGKWCASHGVLHLFLAHHGDDQAETFLGRLARGSGVDGLASMATVAYRPMLRIIRPFLDIPGACLRAYGKKHGLEWFDDPSNRHRRFTRVRIRQAAPILAEEGLTRSRIIQSAGHMARARATLEEVSAAAAGRIARTDEMGAIGIDHARLCDCTGDTLPRILAAALRCVSGSRIRPRWKSLCLLIDHVIKDCRTTVPLHGCLVLKRRRYGRDIIIICREPHAIGHPMAIGPVTAGKSILWDRRFTLTMDLRQHENHKGSPYTPLKTDKNWCWRPLSSDDLPGVTRTLAKKLPWRPPHQIIASLPVLYYRQRSVLLPHFPFVDIDSHDPLDAIGIKRDWKIGVRWTPAHGFFPHAQSVTPS